MLLTDVHEGEKERELRRQGCSTPRPTASAAKTGRAVYCGAICGGIESGAVHAAGDAMPAC